MVVVNGVADVAANASECQKKELPSPASVADLPHAFRRAKEERRILIAWENGRHLGHLSRLTNVAKLVADSGVRLNWAVPKEHLEAVQVLDGADWTSIAPRRSLLKNDTSNVASARSVNSYANILASLGFTDQASLHRDVLSWLRLMEDSASEAAILDYAPVAQFAAFIYGIPSAQITNGFDTPPSTCPLFGVGIRGPMLDRQNGRLVEEISATIDRVATSFGMSGGTSLEDLLRYPVRWYDCSEESDPYGPRNDGVYVGPVGRPLTSMQIKWPAGGADVARVFVYLRDGPMVSAVLEALDKISARVICVWPGARNSELAAIKKAGRVVVNVPVDLRGLLQECDAVVNYGSTTLVSQCLVAGKPQLMLPCDVEKLLVARRISSQGAGLMLKWPLPGPELLGAVKSLLESTDLQERAQRIAHRTRDIGSRLPKEVGCFLRNAVGL